MPFTWLLQHSKSASSGKTDLEINHIFERRIVQLFDWRGRANGIFVLEIEVPGLEEVTIAGVVDLGCLVVDLATSEQEFFVWWISRDQIDLLIIFVVGGEGELVDVIAKLSGQLE